MVKEYFFSNTPSQQLELPEIFEVSDENIDIRYVVSNIKSTNAEIYAPEINFYLENSEDAIRERTTNIKKLYDIRATAFDYAQDVESSIEVGRNVIIISSEMVNALSEELRSYGFSPQRVIPSNITEINGCIGKFRVAVKIDDKSSVLETDQIIWFGAPQSAKTRSGVYDPEILGTEKVVEKIKKNCGTYYFKNFIKYDSSICQYNQRRQEVCGKCTDICPTGAISKDIGLKELRVSDIECIGCGRCVSVCPTGSLDYAPIPIKSFETICEFYKDKIALIIPGRIDFERAQFRLKEDVLPLVLDSEEFLTELHFLSLLKKTGNPIIIYTDCVPSILENVILLINEIFLKIFNRQAIYTCQNVNELNEIFNKVSPLENSLFDINEEGLKKREVLSLRLSRLVKKNDFGIVHTGPHIHYGNLTINEATCTLCLSCADACRIGALTAHSENNTLRFNPSLCTSCGYCEITCPEPNCLQIVHDQLSLRPEYFKKNVMAQDELFKCIECGVGFAPAKSIRKIAEIMEPLFGKETIKVKTLYCCPDCKAKVMLENLTIENINK